jgi:hypothetical protein
MKQSEFSLVGVDTFLFTLMQETTNVNTSLHRYVAKCFQWRGGTAFFILIQETESVNMFFPHDVAEAHQLEGRATHSFYSHAWNNNCKHVLRSWCRRVPSVGVKGDTVFFTLIQETELVNMSFPPEEAKFLHFGGGGDTVFLISCRKQKMYTCA